MFWNYALVFLVAMVPVAELRLAVPMAVGMGIPELNAILVCVLGNMLPVPFIYFFARKILVWGMEKKYIGWFCRALHNKGEKAGRKLTAKAGRYGVFLALMLFVGIPLPGTGAWTGTMGASFLNMGIKSTVVSVCLGVVIAGLIMLIASTGVFAVIGL